MPRSGMVKLRPRLAKWNDDEPASEHGQRGASNPGVEPDKVHRRSLASAVRSEKPEDVTARHLEGDAVQRPIRAVAFAQIAHSDEHVALRRHRSLLCGRRIRLRTRITRWLTLHGLEKNRCGVIVRQPDRAGLLVHYDVRGQGHRAFTLAAAI